jgi:hypothetical protein
MSKKHTEHEKPVIDGLKDEPHTHFPGENEVAPPEPCEPKPAELDQDPGGGYNPDGTYPQT